MKTELPVTAINQSAAFISNDGSVGFDEAQQQLREMYSRGFIEPAGNNGYKFHLAFKESTVVHLQFLGHISPDEPIPPLQFAIRYALGYWHGHPQIFSVSCASFDAKKNELNPRQVLVVDNATETPEAAIVVGLQQVEHELTSMSRSDDPVRTRIARWHINSVRAKMDEYAAEYGRIYARKKYYNIEQTDLFANA